MATLETKADRSWEQVPSLIERANVGAILGALVGGMCDNKSTQSMPKDVDTRIHVQSRLPFQPRMVAEFLHLLQKP